MKRQNGVETQPLDQDILEIEQNAEAKVTQLQSALTIRSS